MPDGASRDEFRQGGGMNVDEETTGYDTRYRVLVL